MKKILFILCALLLTSVGAGAQSSWTAPEPTASSLTSGYQYYLYNTEAGQYACMGNYKWGTNAIFGDNGLLFTLASASTTDYDGTSVTSYTMTSSNGQLFWDGTYLYCDGSSKTDIYFVFTETSTGSKVYTIHGTYAAMNTYIGYDPSDSAPSGGYGAGTDVKAVLPALTGTEGQGIEWELIAENDYELYIAKLDLYNVLVEAEELGMTDTNTAYKNAGDVYNSTTATVEEIEAALIALELAMDVDSDNHIGDEVTVNGTRYEILTDNAVVNHSFELGFEGWTDATSNHNTLTSENFSLENDGAQHKDYYLVGNQNGGSSAASSINNVWPIEAGKTYYFSYWVKGLNSSATNGYYLMTSVTNTIGNDYDVDNKKDSDGAHLLHNFDGGEDKIGTEWQKVEVVFTNGEDGADDYYQYLQIKFRWLDKQWGFDNFSLHEVEHSTDVVADDCDYKEGDEIEMSNFKGTVVGTNLFVNGGFNNGVDGWTAGNGYTNALDGSAVTFTETGGYNDGQYITLKTSAGASAETTPTQAIEVTPGKCYLFVGYTSGTAPSSANQRYSALFAMASATSEANHTEDANDSSTFSNDLVTLEWGDGDEDLNGWTKTMGVFSVPAEGDDYSFSYVGMRMNWSQGSYDGLQLYELDGAFTFPEDADYKIDDEVTIDDVTYTVKSDNLVENGSFNERTTGWTYGNKHVGPLNPYNVNYSTSGGYNDGPYITSKGGHGDENSNVPSKEVDVETGKTYLFVGYTNGTTPSNNKAYNGLFPMSDKTTEGSVLIQMNWDDPDEELNGWTKTEGVFTATTDYVGVRFSWCSGACFDGIQIYEVQAPAETIEWEMTSAGWGTLILPFDVDDEDALSGLTLYAGDALTLDSDGTTITVGDASETIEANTPYLVEGTDAKTYEFTGVATNTQDSYTSGMLTGTLVDMTQDDFAADGSEYVLQNHEGENGEAGEGLAFYPITSESTGVTLDAYHCYLTLDNSTSPDGVRAFISLPGSDNEETGIVAVEGAEAEANDAIYDLSGRRVAKAVKGVYIQNGKKVLVK